MAVFAVFQLCPDLMNRLRVEKAGGGAGDEQRPFLPGYSLFPGAVFPLVLNGGDELPVHLGSCAGDSLHCAGENIHQRQRHDHCQRAHRTREEKQPLLGALGGQRRGHVGHGHGLHNHGVKDVLAVFLIVVQYGHGAVIGQLGTCSSDVHGYKIGVFNGCGTHLGRKFALLQLLRRCVEEGRALQKLGKLRRGTGGGGIGRIGDGGQHGRLGGDGKGGGAAVAGLFQYRLIQIDRHNEQQCRHDYHPEIFQNRTDDAVRLDAGPGGGFFTLFHKRLLKNTAHSTTMVKITEAVSPEAPR